MVWFKYKIERIFKKYIHSLYNLYVHKHWSLKEVKSMKRRVGQEKWNTLPLVHVGIVYHLCTTAMSLFISTNGQSSHFLTSSGIKPQLSFRCQSRLGLLIKALIKSAFEWHRPDLSISCFSSNDCAAYTSD